MKPHEEEWGSAEDFEVTICGPELDRGIDAQREVLARAAPDMARALLALLQDGHVQGWCGAPDGEPCSDDSECGMARTALTKAGVLP